jgi:hypothetical protein
MDTLMSYKKSNQGFIIISAVFFFILIILSVILWIINKLRLNKKNCSYMNALYEDFPLIKSINPNSDQFGLNLRDYYIKTAYNCCSAGKYKNDFVNLCALKDCIKQGARCLDFQVFSLNNQPVIAVSTQQDFFLKESYNTIPFSHAMEIISDYAFAGSTCPNPFDPLIIHLRIMSTNTIIYDKISDSISTILENRILGKKYSYESGGENFGTTPIKDLMGKIVLIVDKTNPLFETTKLDEYVNIASNSVYMRCLRFHDVKYTPDMQELIEFNKKNMSICIPDLSQETNNPSGALSMKYGCQFVGMSFQNFDSNMEFYDETFDDAGTAFVLKPAELRFIPVTIPLPDPPPEEYSYKERPVTSDYYSFTI